MIYDDEWENEELSLPDRYTPFGRVQTGFDCDGPLRCTVYLCRDCGALIPRGDGVRQHDAWHGLR